MNVPEAVIKDQVTGMSHSEWALLNSLMPVGGMVGALLGGPISNSIGRKGAVCALSLAFCSGFHPKSFAD